MKPQFKPGPVQDPAGLDQLLLAAGKGCARYLESLASRQLGRPGNFWDGAEGLGAVLTEHLKAAGVPNKRLPELLTPRAVVATYFPDVRTPEEKRRARNIRRGRSRR